MRATATRTVRAPVEDVWAVLTDHEAMRHWLPGLSVELTKAGPAQRNGAGAVRRFSTPLPLPGIVEEVVDFDPPHRMSYRALAGVPLRNYGGEVVLTPDGAATRIDYTIRADRRLPLIDRLATQAVALALLTALVRQVGRR